MSGHVFVAGCGHDGRLGNGNEKNQHKFVVLNTIPNNASVKAVIAGGFHTYLVTDGDHIYSFGLNEHGQLGLGSKNPCFKTPQPVTFFESRKRPLSLQSDSDLQMQRHRSLLAPSCGLIDLCCGAYHSIAWLTDGLYVCGANDHGQLGLGDFENRFGFVHAAQIPIPIEHLYSISCGTFHTALVVTNVQVSASQLSKLNITDGRDNGENDAPEAATGKGSDQLSTEQGQLKNMIDKALAEETDTSDKIMLPYAILTCGKGDFGELGYDADEWDKLSAMEKRLKQHVANKATYVSQGGDGNNYADFAVGGTNNSAQCVGAAKFKPKPKFSKAPIVRRPEFSSHTFRRVTFPFLDGFGISLATSSPVDGEQASTDVASHTTKRVVTSVIVKAMHHHTAVEINTSEASPRLGRAPKRHLFHFGCLYCNQIETAATSAPRSIPEDIINVHAADEIFFSVNNTSEEGDKIYIIGKGNLGLGEEDDFQEVPRELSLLPPSQATDDKPFVGYKVISIVGKTHFFITVRWLHAISDEEGVVCTYTFGDNFMGQTALNTEENAIVTPTIVTGLPSQEGGNGTSFTICCGFRHTIALAVNY